MSSGAVLLGILGALLVGAMSPGPSFLLVSRIAIARSRAHGLAAAAGMGLGGTAFAGLALLGLAALLHRVPWLYLGLKLAGALYLVWLALRIWRGARQPLTGVGPADAPDRSLSGSFGLALMTQLANPKAAVIYGSIFVALLPARPEPWLVAVLPAMIFAVETGWYVLVALVFSSARPRAAYLRGKVWADGLAATVLGFLGINLALDALGFRRP